MLVMHEPDRQPFPEWARTRWITGLTQLPRTTQYDLINKNLIKSASLKLPGQRKGVRLIHVQSVLDYIEAHVVSGKSNKEPTDES